MGGIIGGIVGLIIACIFSAFGVDGFLWQLDGICGVICGVVWGESRYRKEMKKHGKEM